MLLLFQDHILWLTVKKSFIYLEFHLVTKSRDLLLVDFWLLNNRAHFSIRGVLRSLLLLTWILDQYVLDTLISCFFWQIMRDLIWKFTSIWKDEDTLCSINFFISISWIHLFILNRQFIRLNLISKTQIQFSQPFYFSKQHFIIFFRRNKLVLNLSLFLNMQLALFF